MTAILRAMLGPTNTGKTHYAVERMLAYSSGMMGLPLRLLAREVYDRVVALKGKSRVALITGEEKISPRNPAYIIATVEAMPLERSVAFLAVDEIQLAADPQRGHIFTDRLLHARGRDETVFLGSDTAKPLIKQLLPDCEILSRPRLSTLSYDGVKKYGNLPPRSAVVAFTANDVYSIAELIRRRRGGAAVVMGALSPRTRNAQVKMFQEREVDYLVATDAIGMGLNLNVDHVVFASTVKFDGRMRRRLSAAEMGQIAGRAGRHENNGYFSVTDETQALDGDLVQRIEDHDFEENHGFYWRNRALDFSNLPGLIHSLAARPTIQGLWRAPEADDEIALKALSNQAEIQQKARGGAALKLLWDVCRIPDFRQIHSSDHVELLGKIFKFIHDGGRLPNDFIEKNVAPLSTPKGDIDTLTAKIAAIRVWTYISYRDQWLDDAALWQHRTRAIEDSLSDALHERLTHRFVDKQTTALLRGLKEKRTLVASVAEDGIVKVEGQAIGTLKGFAFIADADAADEKAVKAAANRVLVDVMPKQVAEFMAADDATIGLSDTGQIIWHDMAIAELIKGADILHPQISMLDIPHVAGTDQERIRERLVTWLEGYLQTNLGSLYKLFRARLKGTARGVAYQIWENMGCMYRENIAEMVKSLGSQERFFLRQLGVKFAETTVFVPFVLKPKKTALRHLLWALWHEKPKSLPLPPAGLTSVPVDSAVPVEAYEMMGFRAVSDRVFRVDMLEKVAEAVRKKVEAKEDVDPGSLTSLMGCSVEELDSVLKFLGYKSEKIMPEVPEGTELSEEEKEKQHLIRLFRDRAPRRRKPQGEAGGERKADGGQKRQGGAPRGDRGDRGKGGPRKGGKRPPQDRGPKTFSAEAPSDPSDSPFAALGALKQQMNSKK